MIENCPMRHENGNCIPAGGFCTANKNICEALLNAYRMGKAQLFKESATSDLISRQAAIDAIENSSKPYVWQGAEIVRNLPPAQPEPQWIPVSERLPEKGGEYLVSVHHTIGAVSVFHPEKDTYVDDVAIMKYYGKFPSTVRAWMPLPEPYKSNK